MSPREEPVIVIRPEKFFSRNSPPERICTVRWTRSVSFCSSLTTGTAGPAGAAAGRARAGDARIRRPASAKPANGVGRVIDILTADLDGGVGAGVYRPPP